MSENSFMKEFPFRYEGMSCEEYLYLMNHISKNNIDIYDMQKNCKLQSVNKRTKKEVFDLFGLDYQLIEVELNHLLKKDGIVM